MSDSLLSHEPFETSTGSVPAINTENKIYLKAFFLGVPKDYFRRTRWPRGLSWVCGRSLVGTAGSNPAGGMDVYLL